MTLAPGPARQVAEALVALVANELTKHPEHVKTRRCPDNLCMSSRTLRPHARRLHVQAGQRFGRGVVVDPEVRLPQPHKPNSSGQRGARLRCACGTEYAVPLAKLLAGQSVSCGCQRRETAAARLGQVYKNGVSRHPYYQLWKSMLSRCENEREPGFPDYGGRGIKVCERWRDFQTFVADIEAELGPRPPGQSLDRKDNDGDYELGNVRWADQFTQIHNRRNVRELTAEVARLRKRVSELEAQLANA